MDERFDELRINLLNNLDHPALIQQLKRNINFAAYTKHLNQDVKLPSRK